MNGRIFFDTDIFIYAYDPRDSRKQTTAIDLIQRHAIEGNAVISYQVIKEFFNFALVKAATRLRPEDATLLLENVFRPLQIVPSSIPLVSDAIHLQSRYHLSWYDSLIVSAAQQAGCSLLYSEDLQHGQTFGALTVHNPFH